MTIVSFVNFCVYCSIISRVYNKSCCAICIQLRCSLAFQMLVSATSDFKVAASITIIVNSSTFFAAVSLTNQQFKFFS